jgi:hypothetical protein
MIQRVSSYTIATDELDLVELIPYGEERWAIKSCTPGYMQPTNIIGDSSFAFAEAHRAARMVFDMIKTEHLLKRQRESMLDWCARHNNGELTTDPIPIIGIPDEGYGGEGSDTD